MLGKFTKIGCYILLATHLAQFVGLGEDDAEGDAVLAQPFHKLHVYALRLVTDVDEDKEVGHELAFQDVGGNHLFQLVLGFLAALGESVTGKIHQVPLLVDEEVVDEHGLSRHGGCLGQLVIAGEHVYETALAHIASTDEGVFR